MSHPERNSRRDFILKSTAVGLAATLVVAPRVVGAVADQFKTKKSAGPVLLSSRNGPRAIVRALEIIQSGGDALEAVVAGVNLV